LDFGAGFYTTSSFKQAKSWAISRLAFRLAKGLSIEGLQPTVSVYDFNDSEARSNFKVLDFKTADIAWLEYVAKNRREESVEPYDLIIGPVADDKTMKVVVLYVRGRYTAEEAIRRLEPEKLDNQYTFANRKALQYLTFEGVEIIEEN